MLKAVISHNEQATIVELPMDRLSLQYELSQIGIRRLAKDIPIMDEEDQPISVKLYSESDIGQNLAMLFRPSHSLEDANVCAHAVVHARPEVQDEIEQSIVYGQYHSPQAVLADIKAMTTDLIAVTVNYYCPLQVRMTDEEYGDWYEVDNGYALDNISHNVTWGKARSAKEGNVFFAYKSFLGYRRGADGKPEIDPEQANTVRRIYDRFLAGDSLQQIANGLTADGIPTPMSRTVWQASVVQSILSNEKYKGDALLGKTYVEDCISKKVRVNAGERPQYYVENNHPAIIDTATFARVQEELARRASKRKVKQTGTTTEQGKYCGKYALTELLICGECGTPYRRCTWTVGGKKRIVWRCINRLDYGKKYCHHSPTMEEAPLQNAIMDAVLKTAQIDPNILQTLKQHIRLGLGAGAGEDKSVEIQIRIAQIDQEFKSLLNSVTAENQQELLTDPRITDLMTEKRQLEKELAEYAAAEQHRQNTASRLDNIFTILDGMKNHPLTYDDAVIRQILQCVIVESKEKIKVVFIGGMEVETEVEQ